MTRRVTLTAAVLKPMSCLCCCCAVACCAVLQPLPQDALQVLVKLQLHTKYRDHGWNALHYACAAQRVGECMMSESNVLLTVLTSTCEHTNSLVLPGPALNLVLVCPVFPCKTHWKLS